MHETFPTHVLRGLDGTFRTALWGAALNKNNSEELHSVLWVSLRHPRLLANGIHLLSLRNILQEAVRARARGQDWPGAHGLGLIVVSLYISLQFFQPSAQSQPNPTKRQEQESLSFLNPVVQ